MKKRSRVLVGLALAGLWLTGLGFVVFAGFVMREPRLSSATADGIVVLTGGETRIAEAARLLDEGRGQRLLISGVNQSIGRKSLLNLSGLTENTFSCCVDLGYAAQNTVGNAVETQRWAAAHSYGRLLVVTASYHMPRSLAELARVMPDVELIPHPVKPAGLRGKVWWLDAQVFRIVAFEYLKFVPAVLRLVLARGVSPWQGTQTAGAQDAPPKS